MMKEIIHNFGYGKNKDDFNTNKNASDTVDISVTFFLELKMC